MPSPDLSPEPGWDIPERRPIDHRSFVSGDPEGDRLRVAYYWDPAAEARVAKVWFGPGAEGPPGHAHGGSVAAVLDEAMGTNAWAQDLHVLAGTLTIRFRRAVPLGLVATVRTGIDRIEGRKVYATGRIEGPDGTLYAEGDGIFVIMDEQGEDWMRRTADALGRPTPDVY